MTKYTLLGISGSLRQASYNRMLVREAARLFDPASFVQADIAFPLYDGDLEEAEGLPTSVNTVVSQIATADAVVISGPEYNKSISGVLKNALDWISRADAKPWADKPVAILSATAGRSGGEMTQASMRECLVPFGPRVLTGPSVLVGGAFKEFDDGGRLTNKRYESALSTLMDTLKSEIAR